MVEHTKKKEEPPGPLHPASKHWMGIALALVVVAIAGNYVLLSKYDKRLAAIELGLSERIPPQQFAGTTDAPSTYSGIPSSSVRLQPRTRTPGSIHARPLPGTSPEGVEQRRMNRLVKLETAFQQEGIDNRWAARTEAHVQDALAYAVANSGLDPIGSSVSCRSSSCRIQVDMSLSSDPEDMLLQLSVDLSEVLPRSKTVVLPDGKGNKRLSIFATR